MIPLAKLATEAPESILITPELIQWAKKSGLPEPTEAIIEHCLDWHRARGNKFKDWNAVLRNWMRGIPKYEGNKFVHTAQSHQEVISKPLTPPIDLIEPGILKEFLRNFVNKCKSL